jgi:hypothetical protein
VEFKAVLLLDDASLIELEREERETFPLRILPDRSYIRA